MMLRCFLHWRACCKSIYGVWTQPNQLPSKGIVFVWLKTSQKSSSQLSEKLVCQKWAVRVSNGIIKPMEDGVAAASPFRQGFMQFFPSLQHWGAEFKEGTMGTFDPNDWNFFLYGIDWNFISVLFFLSLVVSPQ